MAFSKLNEIEAFILFLTEQRLRRTVVLGGTIPLPRFDTTRISAQCRNVSVPSLPQFSFTHAPLLSRFGTAQFDSFLDGQPSQRRKMSAEIVWPLFSLKSSKRGKMPEEPDTIRARRGKGFGHPTSQNFRHARATQTYPSDGKRHQDNIHPEQEEIDHIQRNDVHNLKSPQIHLPPRLVPGMASHHQHLDDHHHQHHQNPMSALLSFIPGRGGPQLVSSTNEWKRLEKHAELIKSTHLRDLLQDVDRCNTMYATHDGVYLDYSRQRATLETIDLLLDLAKKQDLKGKINSMVNGEKINFTEDRAVLHTALRAERDQIGKIFVDGGLDAVEEVHEVLDQVKKFTNAVRSGEIKGYTGKRMRNIVSVGIGGSYLGPEFLHECLKTEPEGINSALGYSLRFLSNVDPVDVERTCADLDPEETLIVVVSKTFTTAETMLNARTMRQWLWDFMGNDVEVVRKHVVACASVSATEKVKAFGIDTEKFFFRFWDWVGGRYSVCSAAGAVPISLLYGYDLFEKFLKGANSIDKHFMTAPFNQNIPVLLGLLGVWNMSFLGYNARTTLPYAEALLKLPAHIQQLDMESNGKHVTRSGLEVDYPVGEVDFGEPGTNGQHSFFQLLHMGQTVPCDFIGFVQSQHDLCIDGEFLSSHDELMANFFAQPDALAKGKTADEVRAEGVDEDLVIHRIFHGNRPSSSLLLPKLTAYATGQLLAIYEHRTAVQGFLWDINSFDQWGVELGKKLAIDIKDQILEARSDPLGRPVDTGSPATSRILNYYVENGHDSFLEESRDANTLTRVMRKTHRDHVPPSAHDLGGNTGKLS